MAVLENKRIIVTGASRGIGLAIARACLRAGAVVGAGYVASEARIGELVREHPRRVRPLRFDVSDPQAAMEAIGRFIDGEGRVDGLVNNAGVGGSPDFLVRVAPSRLEQVVRTNLLGPMFCSRAVLPMMLKQRSGVIVNMSSVSAVRPTPATTAYAASKGGLESLTYAMAIEYAHRGVRVHCVRPGPVGCGMLEAMPPAARDALTARLPTGELIDADQVAKTVVFLLRGEIDHMTGGVVTLDGGYLLG